jgi:formiminotetrahydrofolate cyclodeaminase
VKLVDRSLASFLAELGSASPAPGGGSAAALAGAAAAALCAMVCRLTLGRESYRQAWPETEKSLAQSQRLEARLRTLIDEDADAYLAVVAARGLPRETASQKEARKAAIQEAAVRAAAAPLATLEALQECVGIVGFLAEKGSLSCRTDTGSAGALCRAGAEAAACNVRVNLPSIADAALRGSLSARTREALADIRAASDLIAKQVENHLEERSLP